MKGRLNVRIDYSIERKLRRLANDEGISLSDLVRDMSIDRLRRKGRLVEVVEVKSK